MRVLESRALAEGIYSLTLQYAPGEEPQEVRPGQFVGIFPNDASSLLLRPISICRWDAQNAALRMVYRTAGKGTSQFAALKEGDEISMLGILGNGYDVEQMKGGKVLLLGGGIGIPPMLELACALSAEGSEVTCALGYRSSELFLKEEFEKVSRVLIATEDGSVGVKGNVLDAVREDGCRPDYICSCGPMPMLKAVKAFAEEIDVPCYISLEERMACGVGACLGCIVKTAEKDEHSNVNNTRICTEGPVFFAEDVLL